MKKQSAILSCPAAAHHEDCIGTETNHFIEINTGRKGSRHFFSITNLIGIGITVGVHGFVLFSQQLLGIFGEEQFN